MKHRIEVRVKNKEKVLDGRVMKLPARLVHQQGRSTPLLCEEPSCGYHRPCDLGQSADHAVREAEGRHDERPRQEKGKEH